MHIHIYVSQDCATVNVSIPTRSSIRTGSYGVMSDQCCCICDHVEYLYKNAYVLIAEKRGTKLYVIPHILVRDMVKACSSAEKMLAPSR